MDSPDFYPDFYIEGAEESALIASSFYRIDVAIDIVQTIFILFLIAFLWRRLRAAAQSPWMISTDNRARKLEDRVTRLEARQDEMASKEWVQTLSNTNRDRIARLEDRMGRTEGVAEQMNTQVQRMNEYLLKGSER